MVMLSVEGDRMAAVGVVMLIVTVVIVAVMAVIIIIIIITRIGHPIEAVTIRVINDVHAVLLFRR